MKKTFEKQELKMAMSEIYSKNVNIPVGLIFAHLIPKKINEHNKIASYKENGKYYTFEIDNIETFLDSYLK